MPVRRYTALMDSASTPLIDLLDAPEVCRDLAGLLGDIATGCAQIAALARRGALAGLLGDTAHANAQGEVQKLLDVRADQLFLDALIQNRHLAGLASEERDGIWRPQHAPSRGYLVAVDPLDGSSNVANNYGIGTIFSVLRAPEAVTAAAFLQPGTRIVAAGYCLYGPATVLTLSTGHGVHQLTLDPDTGDFILTRRSATIPPQAVEFAVNMSRRDHWDPPVQRYIRECITGARGPRGRDFNMRWIASLVAEVHRLLARGGVFAYPLDEKLRAAGHAGRLRLLYELLPMAFLVEQAGGAASTGSARLLALAPTALHARAPVFLGTAEEIARIERYHREA